MSSNARKLARVAYLTGEYPKVSHTFILREAEALRRHGLEVFTCSIRTIGSENLTGPEEKSARDTTFYVLPAAKNPVRLLSAHISALFRSPARYVEALSLAVRTSSAGPKAMLYQLFYFLEAGVLADHLRQHKVQHLHNHFANSSCSVAMLTSVLSGIPFSFTMHGPAVFFEAEKWRLDEKIARAAFVSCISHFCRSQGMIFAAPEHWSKMHIVHCGVTPDRYQRTDPSQTPSAGRPAGLVFVGRMAAVKGVPVLLNAIAALNGRGVELNAVLVGDGAERSRLEARMAELGIADRVEITGYKSQSEVADYLAAADVFVLPSFAEGVPVVLMEAMATGLPVVTTRIAGIPELVEHTKNGYVVPPGDAASLAGAIEKLVTAPGLREEMGAAGQKKVQAFYDIDKESDWLLTIMRASFEGGAPLGLRPAEEPATEEAV